jgi:hypothetical protein
MKPGPGQVALDVQDVMTMMDALNDVIALGDMGMTAIGRPGLAERIGDYRSLLPRLDGLLVVYPADDTDNTREGV